MATQVIDVSTHNGSIDFNKVRAAGIENVIIRCGFTGYGKSQTLNKDARFEENYKKAKEAGLHVGAYYFSVALTEADADREADFVLSLLKDKQFDLPIYYDVEDVHDTTQAGVLTQNMGGLSKAALTAIVNRFCETVEKAGYFVGIYSGKYWFKDKMDMSVLNRYTVWLAHWTTKTDYTGPYALWQYTDSGRVDGITTAVDMNELYQDFASVIKRLGLNGYPKQPAEQTVLMGDVNSDGAVTEEDALLTLRRTVGLESFTEEQAKRADMDGDGNITAEDAREILRKSAGMEG